MAPPQRQKNLRVHESINSDQAALRNIIVHDDVSDEKELKFLQLLEAKEKLGILSREDIQELVVLDDPVETLTLKILRAVANAPATHMKGSIGHGVCDQQTGVCACEAGYNGSSCEVFNLRECNVGHRRPVARA